MTTPRIIVVGSTMMDQIAYVDRIPSAGETVTGTEFALGFGGKGANQAVMAARLGAAVTMVNCVGDDVFGEMTIRNLAAEGIDVRHVLRRPGAATGAAPIWVEPDGTNRIVVVPGANALMTPAQAERAVRDAGPVDLVIGQLEAPQEVTAAGFAAARSAGARCLLNPAPAAPLLPALLATSDWIAPNEVEFRSLATASGLASADPRTAGDVERLAAALGARLAVTLGADGATISGAGGPATPVPTPAVQALDTTGAGDAFVGGFAFGLAAGLPEIAAAALGCRCAASAVTRRGTQASFPRGAELDDIRRAVAQSG